MSQTLPETTKRSGSVFWTGTTRRPLRAGSLTGARRIRHPVRFVAFLVFAIAAIMILSGALGAYRGIAPPDGSIHAANAAPAITISPTSGPPGTPVTVTLYGFPPSPAQTAVNLTNPSVPGYNIESDPFFYLNSSGGAAGLFDPTIDGFTAGTYEFVANVPGTSTNVSADFVATPSNTSLSATPTTGCSGASIQLNGSLIYPYSYFVAYIGSARNAPGYVQVADGATNATGNFSTTFTVPALSGGGAYTLFAQDGDYYAATSFSFSCAPSLTLDPPQGALGSTIVATGANFAPDSPITMTASPSNGGTVPICSSTTSDSDGGFTCTFTDPATAGNASDTIAASDDAGNHSSAVFTIVSPSLSLALGSGEPGQILGVSGVGFPPDTEVDVPFGSTGGTCSAMSSSSGSFSCTLAVPLTSDGDVDVSGQANGNTYATREFDVTSFPTNSFPAYFWTLSIPDLKGYKGDLDVDGSKNYFEALNWTLTGSMHISLATPYSAGANVLLEDILQGKARDANLEISTYFAGEDSESEGALTVAHNDTISYKGCTGLSADEVFSGGATTITFEFQCSQVGWTDYVPSSGSAWATNSISYQWDLVGSTDPAAVVALSPSPRSTAGSVEAEDSTSWYLAVSGETHATGYESFSGRQQMEIINFSLFATSYADQFDFNVSLRATIVNDLFLINVEKGDLKSITLRAYYDGQKSNKPFDTTILEQLEETDFYETGRAGQAPSLWETFTVGELSITT